MLPVVIVGGGISGLAAAYELQQRGCPFLLAEAMARVGGVILTERIGPCIIDAGPDSIVVTKGGAETLCRDLGIADRLVSPLRPRTAFVLRHGRLRPLPTSGVFGLPTRPSDLARLRVLSLRGRARALLDCVLPASTPAPEADESLAAFFQRRLGKEVVSSLVEPLLAGIHAGDVDRLSVRATLPHLAEAEAQAGSLVGALARVAASQTDRDAAGPFRSLPGGMGELVETVLRVLPQEQLHLRSRVVAVRPAAGAYEVLTQSGAVHSAAAVILAVPAYVVAAIVEPIDGELAELCRQIRYTSTATAVLAYPRDHVHHPLAGSGFVVPRTERGASILAATWITSKWPGRAPCETVLLRGFVGGSRHPDILEEGDAQLARRVHADLSRILGIHSAPNLVRVHRWERANPQYEVGHLDRLAAIDRRLAGRPGLFLTGSGLRAVGISDCIADGRRVARLANRAAGHSSASV